MTRPLPGLGGRRGFVRPSWTIVADLTPRELLESRELKVLHRTIAACLAGVLALCMAGFVASLLDHHSQAAALNAAETEARTLATEQRSYVDVTDLQARTSDLTAKLSGLTANAVDVAALVTQARAALPHTVALTSVTVTVAATQPNTSGLASTALSTTPGQIGTVTLTGTAQHLVDLAGYVTALSALPGVIDVVPDSNRSGTQGLAGSWSITLAFTDALYLHRASSGDK